MLDLAVAGELLFVLERVHGARTGYTNADLPAALGYLGIVTLLFFLVWRLKRMRVFSPRHG